MDDLSSQSKVFTKQRVEYKNIQRRVYDALHVLIAIGYLIKIDNTLYYNCTFLNKYKENKRKSGNPEKDKMALKDLANEKKKLLTEKTIQVNHNKVFFP